MDPDVENSQPKRRKVRKGTRTCWECKRRKVRCIFEPPNNAVCVGCTRRCLRCVGQEFPEEPTTSAVKSRLVGDRIVRVEAMIQQLVQQSGKDAASTTAPVPAGIDTSARTEPHVDTSASPHLRVAEESDVTASVSPRASSRCTATQEENVDNPGCLSVVRRGAAESPHSRARSVYDARAGGPHTISNFQAPTTLMALPQAVNDRLAEALLAVYPSQHDLDLIVASTSLAYGYYQIFLRSYRDIKKHGFLPPTELCVRYSTQTHPVIIARQMLLIAMVLQISDFTKDNKLVGLSEPVDAIMTRLSDTAIRLVTSNDALLDTIDGLECIFLEAMYRGNSGNLRRAWLTWRRAYSMAQLMCIPRHNRHHPPPTASRRANGMDPQFLWYRITTAERFLSLLLGLPQASLEASVASAEVLGNDSPTAALEQKLSEITSYISRRNERGPHADDYAATEKIDREMQAAAAALPGRWWLAPNLATMPPGEACIWETVRLSDQIFYYHLLHQLHLPYMMQPTSSSDADQQRFEYSRMACLSSSREILTRYIVFRNFNRIACCYRFVEFFALMAALTLILVHLDRHRNARQADAFLAHQRLADRAMTEEVLASMDRVCQLNEDAITETSVGLLHQLLAIEADTARGADHTLASCGDDVRSAGELRLSVPYVGVVTIGRDGTVTKDAHERAPVAGMLPSQNIHSSACVTTTPDTTSLSSTMAAPASMHTASGPQLQAGSAFPHNVRGSGILTPPSLAQSTDGDATCEIQCLQTGTSTETCLQAAHNNGTNAPSAEGSQLCEASASAGLPRGTPSILGSLDNLGSPQTVYPRPAAGTDQWAFQGVDMAFFDNLIRETNNTTETGSSNLWTWDNLW
ncbi:Zn(2)-C6 fungal-type DNA-binding domain protein [Niveomyces insectorum RCEF 264]|uniref:Zn(2)-C6 fungal-type DNA-binding domain protein n=1 Tax=Niveomyces insectorum RCEF 264 TaxID=1081102 RepID=A0A167P505_9HYPO|nr:Zn(2)-C6 fungal-type DNA-binding domain protein [Niveomyces insectorum RCEF 264]